MAEIKNSKQRKLWLTWVTLTLGLIAWLSYSMVESEDKKIFMPGPMTGGHHQIGIACESCHTDPLGGGEVLQQACIDCHDEDRVKPFDSHPRSKFKDPRNADRLEHINALACTTCHVEHRPEITARNGVTQPVDFCFHCHEDIAEERPSHKDMAFDTCKSSGCHNFHNNRALYTDFLVKHLGKPAVLEKAELPQREFASVLGELTDYPVDRYPVKQLANGDADAPEDTSVDSKIHQDWLETAHARSGVNCSACHIAPSENDETAQWDDHPDHRACEQCHSLESQRFKRGKHGMRLAAGLSPMTPAQARLPMKPEATHEELTCNSCHSGHRFDVREAAVEACLGCHNDEHSQAYKQSVHYQLWQQETEGTGKPGSGVSCASCHMPRINFDVNDWMSRIMVDHNQNASLTPNSKMIRPVCLHCHGLAYTLDALADEQLIQSNFQGQSSTHVISMELAEADQKRADEETANINQD